MELKTRRAINFWWALASIGAIAVILVAGWFIFNDSDWYLNFLVATILSFTLFWGFYLVYTCFKKNKYPFLTYTPEYSPTMNFFKKVTLYKIIWLWILPIFTGLVCPLIFLVVHATKQTDTFNWQAIVAYLVCIALSVANNLAYVFTMYKRLNDDEVTNQFTMKLD